MKLNIKTLKALENEVLEQLDSKSYAEEENHMSEYFTPEETQVIQRITSEKIDINKPSWKLYTNDIKQTYGCDSSEEVALNIFYDYIESKFNNRALTLNQYVASQIENLK